MAAKSYLRYKQEKLLGLVASPTAGIICDKPGFLVLAAGLEDVLVWNMRSGTQTGRLAGPPDVEVSALCMHPNNMNVAAGYSDGTVRVWDFRKEVQLYELRGHRKRVTCLAYSPDGALLASGSSDTDVTVWDTTAQAGLYRLRGHRDGITSVTFVKPPADGPVEAEGALGGAKRPVAATLLTGTGVMLASASKDGFVKLWDLETQHCVQTVVSHRSEVWALIPSPMHGGRLITGSSDVQVRLWEVCPPARATSLASAAAAALAEAPSAPGSEDEDGDTALPAAPASAVASELVPEYLHGIGSVHRTTADRTVGIATSRAAVDDDSSKPGWLVVHGNNRSVEVWRWRSPADAKRKAARRKRRAREKAGGASGEGAADDEWRHSGAGTIGQDELELFGTFKASAKVRSVVVVPAPALRVNARAAAASSAGGAVSDAALLQQTVQVTVSTHGNTLETHQLQRVAGGTDSDEEEPTVVHTKVASVSQPGHRSDVRAVAMSRDGTLALTTDSKGGKLWNLHSGMCLRTFDSGYGVSATFLPGNRYGVFGGKDGTISVWALSTGDSVATFEGGEDGDGHNGAAWGLAVRPDGRVLATGSADKTVRFWDLDGEGGTLDLVHTRTLKMADEVLAVQFSFHTAAERVLLAVALLDSTVKVFFNDTLKFALSLYGHRLPVMAMDISADNTLLVTASADKTVKVWGLDFGDCHRSFRAHTESAMGVAFLGTSHHFVTGGKDGAVKYWDGDRFEYVTSLPGHKGEVWALSASRDGKGLVTASKDRSIRVWRRSEELVFPDEEREKEMLAASEGDAAAPAATALDGALATHAASAGDAVGDPSAGAGLQEAGAVVITNGGGAAGRASDRLMEAIELADTTMAAWREYSADIASALERMSRKERKRRAAAEREGKPPPPLLPAPSPSPLMLGKTPSEFVLHTLSSIKATDVESALLLLPLDYALSFLRYATHLLRRGVAVERVAKAAQFVVRVHASQLAAGSADTSLLLDSLQRIMTTRLQQLVDLTGVAAAGCDVLHRLYTSEGQAWGGAAPEEAKDDTDGPVVKSFKRRVVLL